MQTNKANAEVNIFVDAVILGTGLSESIISMLLSEQKKKVLVVDTTNCYGSEFATLNYIEFVKLFNAQPNKLFVDISNQFNIDLIPKLLLMESNLKNFFLEKQIDAMVTFAPIKGSYFYSDKLYTITKNEASSLKCKAIGFMQKTKIARFFYNLRNINKNQYEFRDTMQDEFDFFGLDKLSIDFIGHGIAMYTDDKYLNEPPMKTYDRILKYIQSIVSYENSESPFIYPHYGLSDICQAFVRKSACLGGEFMLNAKIKTIKTKNNLIQIYDSLGTLYNIKYTKLISNPSYFVSNTSIDCRPSTIKKEIIRCIMICKKNNKFDGSRTITFSHTNFNRNNDVFGIVLGSNTMSCPKDYEVCILSTIKETSDPKKEIMPFIFKFDVINYYIDVRNTYENLSDSVIFTENVDESPLMDNIYDNVCELMKTINL